MSTYRTARPARRRWTTLVLLAPLSAAVVLAGASPASAIPFEGEPTNGTCLRLGPLPDAGPAGSPLFVSHGYALFLGSGAECSKG